MTIHTACVTECQLCVWPGRRCTRETLAQRVCVEGSYGEVTLHGFVLAVVAIFEERLAAPSPSRSDTTSRELPELAR